MHAVLKGLPLLAGLPDDVLDALALKLEQRGLVAGEILFEKGDPGDALYVVDSGEVKVFVVGEDRQELIFSHLGPGQALGEMSIIDEEPRTASVASVAPTEVLVLRRNDFMDVIRDQPPQVLDELRDVADRLRLGYLDILKSLPLLEVLPDETLTQIADKLEPVQLNEGEYLFHQGDPGNSLYIIESGLVRIVTEDEEGQTLILNQSGPGQAIGEMALLDEQPRSAGVVAASPMVSMLKIGREDFLETLETQPQLSLSVMRYLSRRLRFNTTYLQESRGWFRRIADGEYKSTADQIASERDQIAADDISDEALANEFLSEFVAMITSVQERVEELKTQLQRLTIEIDEAKRKEDFENLTNTDFFADLKAAAQQMREEGED